METVIIVTAIVISVPFLASSLVDLISSLVDLIVHLHERHQIQREAKWLRDYRKDTNHE